MEALLQENHSLLRKLEVKENMESAYLEEIDQLKEALIRLEQEKRSPISVKRTDDSTILKFENCIHRDNELIDSLKEELVLRKKRELELQDLLLSAETRLECIMSDTSQCTSETNDSSSLALAAELAKLKEDLANMEAAGHLAQSKLQRQILELEEDRAGLQQYAYELEKQVKESRSELCDVRAQLEALEMQSNSIEKTRGNSVFAEIEDRRIRAEKLVVKQRLTIDELNQRLRQVETDSKRKYMDALQKQERRFRDRDKSFVDELVAERKRLMSENARLVYQVSHLEDLRLDQERGAYKMSKAFNLDSNTHEEFIASLERRVKTFQRNWEEQKCTTENLRQRLVNACLMRRKLQTELWHCMDDVSRMKRQNEELRMSLNGGKLDAVKVGRAGSGDCKLDSLVHAESVSKSGHDLPQSLASELTDCNVENECPAKDHDQTTKTGPYSKDATTKPNPLTVPTECQTS